MSKQEMQHEQDATVLQRASCNYTFEQPGAVVGHIDNNSDR